MNLLRLSLIGASFLVFMGIFQIAVVLRIIYHHDDAVLQDFLTMWHLGEPTTSTAIFEGIVFCCVGSVLAVLVKLAKRHFSSGLLLQRSRRSAFGADQG